MRRVLIGLVLLGGLAGCEGSPQAIGAQVASGYGYVCAAGIYQCRLPEQVPIGSRCSCPGLGAPSFGTVQ